MKTPMTPRLSKSRYVQGRKCLKRVWLYNHRHDLMQAPSAFQESILTQGTETGELARKLYPGGILIDEDYRDPEGAIEHTQRAIKDNPPALFEAALVYENILITESHICLL